MRGGFSLEPCEIVEPADEWIKARKKTWSHLIQQVYDATPLLSDCGGMMKIISVIEARHQSNVVGKILASIKFVFEVLQLPERPPPAFSPEPDGDRDDGSSSDAFGF